ncbi:arginine deiminase-related protein [Herbaspirillum sp. WKF16]|jgi:N-dimethylarginine dimethylaminohydrolase|uniref:dimethylarginine dimethylaminohydrolase family protein n=1 Tax=Herbaspirillum sp. WKF16 TaxID=3028312 RepID=UPI0023A93CCD|nr:arginine deiminase-related protein [Herbaspirillum sp. WKF16]WDZ95694.1 arginine deiminase-related protein [Herbaspirillum sp. WKF16]
MKQQRHDAFLMCPPQHFGVSYVINPWMEGNVAHADLSLAERQWQALRDGLAGVAQVREMPAAAGVPDMVFTANAGLVLEDQVVLSHFRHAERQAEEPHFRAWFESQGLRVLAMPEHVPFEGAGDALLDRQADLLWMGYGHRTDVRAAPLVAGWLKIEVQSLQLVDPRFYHLDTCFCPLQGGYLMAYLPAFDAASRKAIAARVPPQRLIAVGEEDALRFACNAVNAGRHVFLNRASPALRGQLEEKGFEVHETPLSEFMKAGGAAKCLTLKLDEPRRHADGAANAPTRGDDRRSA